MGTRTMIFGVALVFGAFGLAPAADDKADDKKALQGTWVYESIEWNGKKYPDDQVKMSNITLDGDKFTIMAGDKVTMGGTFKVDPTKSPKTLDLTATEGEAKGNTFVGIYKLDGDTLTTCVNLEGIERPKEFKSTEQSGLTLSVAKRKK